MKIIGTGSAHPTCKVTNQMLEQFLETTDEWITERTGIKERLVISSEKLEDLAVEAANKALEEARNAKTIGKSLEAKIIIKADEDYDRYAELAQQLKEVLIVSDVVVEKAEGETAFVVETPFQLLCAIEAINEFQIEHYLVVVPYFENSFPVSHKPKWTRSCIHII